MAACGEAKVHFCHQATMPHINDTDTTRSGAQMDSPANTPYRRTIQQHRCRQHGLNQEINPSHPARYAVTYENDISWENRKHWIAGTTIKIIDTKTNTLMAEKTMYVFVPELGYSKFEQNPNPWGRGDRCPEENQYQQQTVSFARKVLLSPSFKPEMSK